MNPARSSVASAGLSGRPAAATARPLFAIVGIAAIAVVAGIVGLALLANFGLPPPDGPYPVGVITMTLQRPPEPNVPGGTFDVTVWYPSEPTSVRAPYGTDGPGLKGRIYHRLVRTYAGSDAPFTRNGARFPVLLYVSSWGGEGTANSVLATDLASHGYVVAAFGDTGFDHPPLARLAGTPDFSSADAVAATKRLAALKIRYETQRAMVVRDRLAALDRSRLDRRFTNRLELDRVGTLGFSLGGAVALATCDALEHCAGALNMDGYLWHVRKTHAFPYFLMCAVDRPASPATPQPADQLAYNTARMDADDDLVERSNLSSGGYLLQIPGASHYSFTDLPLFAPLQRLRSAISPTEATEIVDRFTLAFFDAYVKGLPAPLLDRGPKQTPMFTLSEWRFTKSR